MRHNIIGYIKDQQHFLRRISLTGSKKTASNDSSLTRSIILTPKVDSNPSIQNPGRTAVAAVLPSRPDAESPPLQLTGAQAEWSLFSATHNLLKLWRSGRAGQPRGRRRDSAIATSGR